MRDALIEVLPIIMLLVIGKILQQKGLLKKETENQLKSGLINIILPLILFITFKNMTLKLEYIILILITFLMLNCFYFIGGLINKLLKIDNVTLQFFTSAVAFGLLGIPLFEGVYGIDNLDQLSILGISNEFFVWFVYITLLKKKLNNQKFDKNTIFNVIKSPIIIMIFLGLLFNILNIESFIGNYVLYQGLLNTINYIIAMATPLILIVIGAGINLDYTYLKKALYFVVIRLIIMLVLGYLIKLFVIDMFYNADRMFNLAYFTYLILPPPFSLPLFVGQYSTEENTGIINNATVISTLISVFLFVVMVLITS